MMRLVRRGLMFGNLFKVSSPSLVQRYNRALEHLTGKQTNLEEFHIDISGFSPEIGDELDNQLYLNPNGCNRQFILLSIEQKTAPLLNVKFSTSRSIIRRFIDANEDQLFVLTSREAVAGELVNSIYSMDDPVELFNIRTIEIDADTVGSKIEASEKLSGKIETFMTEPDAWWDDVLTADMIELAKHTGDITRNPVKLGHNSFSQENFYTEHFNGLYIFRDLDHPACITFGLKKDLGNLPIENVVSYKSRIKIAAFLEANDLVEPIVLSRDMDIAAVLRQKMDFIVIDSAAGAGENLEDLSRRDLRQLRRKYFRKLPREFHGLIDLWHWESKRGRKPDIDPQHPAYFYTLRSRNHKDKNLVNMLLAQLSPLDFRQLFICHKEAFYASYRGWSDQKKEFAAQFLEDEYLIDKAGARLDLFGPEPGMLDDEFDEAEEYDDVYEDASYFEEDEDTSDDESRRTKPKLRRGPWGPIPRGN